MVEVEVTGKRIAETRHKLGLSYEDLAEVFDVHHTTVRRWEKQAVLDGLVYHALLGLEYASEARS